MNVEAHVHRVARKNPLHRNHSVNNWNNSRISPMPNALGKLLLAQHVFQQAFKRDVCSQNLHKSDQGFLETYSDLTALTKIFKRYGSFIPGPLESRRRLGKRRMAYAFESIYCYKFGLWSWWRYLRGTDLTNWKWQPPKSHAVSLEPKVNLSQPLLPSWLLKPLDTFKKQSTNISLISQSRHNSNHLLQEDFSPLRAVVQAGSTDKIIKAKLILTYNLTRTLSQSTICEEKLLYLIENYSDEFNDKMLDPDLTASLCSIFQFAWEELRNFTTKENVTILPKTTTFILKELSKLPFIREVQDLVTNIIQYTPYLENEKVLYEIYHRIIISWALSWGRDNRAMSTTDYLHGYPSCVYKYRVSDAEKNILRIEQMISNLEKEIFKGMNKSNLNISLQKLRLEIFSCLEVIENAENILIPEKLSSSNLLKTIGYLPRNSIKTLLEDCSKKLCEIFHQNNSERFLNIKRHWLSSISQVTALSSHQFLDLWKYMDTHSKPLPENLNPQILISMWELQGNSKCQALIRNSLETTALGSSEGQELWVSLVSAIYKYYPPELHFNKISRIFQILFLLGKIKIIGKTILHMSTINPRLPAEVLEFVVEIIIDHDPDMAWKIVMLSYIMKPGRKYKSKKYPRGDYRTLRFSYCPKFVVWMIEDSKLKPRYIWKILRIPIHAKLQPRYRNQPSCQPLDPRRINLLKVMANAFACSERLKPRIAFRNVMQCWHHLRHYRTPIDKTILHALLHSGIARCVISGIWVPKGRQVWLLYLVEQVEGFEIARKVDSALRAWNAQVTYKKSRARRELNVLRVGPID